MRIWVKIGGCAGMAYKMEYTESVEPDRRGVVEGKGVRHLVGPKAVLFLLAPRRTCKVTSLRPNPCSTPQPNLGPRLASRWRGRPGKEEA